MCDLFYEWRASIDSAVLTLMNPLAILAIIALLAFAIRQSWKRWEKGENIIPWNE